MLIDLDIDSNPLSIQKYQYTPSKVFKGTPKNEIFYKKNNINVANDPKMEDLLPKIIQPITLNIIRPWSPRCSSTVEFL